MRLKPRLWPVLPGWLALRFSLLFTPLLWLVTLLPFYQWVLFQQTGRRKISPLWATRFMFRNGWRELLALALGEAAVSAGMWLLTALVWNTFARLSTSKAALDAPAPGAEGGTWPPPPTVSASADDALRRSP